MTSPKTCILAAVVGVLSTQVAMADTAELQREVADLKSQVAQLQMSQANNAQQMAATIDAVLRDAEHRTQLAADGGGAGYDNGFYIRTGNFEMKPGIMMQFWNVTDYRQNTDGAKEDELENGFEIHRVEFGVSGTAFSKDLSYNVLFWTGGNSGNVELLDANATYMFSDALGIRAGQFTENFTHEQYLADSGLLAVERSLLDGALGSYPSRVQGAALLYGNYNDKNPINAEIGLTDGSNSINSNYVGHYPSDPGTSFTNHAFDWGMYARAEYKVKGSWAAYQDMTAKSVGKEDLIVLGGAMAYDQGGNADVFGGTLDFQYKGKNGFSLYGAGVILNNNAAFNGDNQTNWGLLLQGSYLFSPAIEGFARVSYVNYDNAVVIGTDSEDAFYEVTVGMNYFLGKGGEAVNRAKITVDLSWLPNGLPGSMTSLGYLGDSNLDSEIVLRGQFQLAL